MLISSILLLSFSKNLIFSSSRWQVPHGFPPGNPNQPGPHQEFHKRLSLDAPSNLDKNYDMTILKRNPNTGEKLVMVKDRRGSLGSPRLRVAINGRLPPHVLGRISRGTSPGHMNNQYNRYFQRPPHFRPDIRHRDLRRLMQPPVDRHRNRLSPDTMHALQRLRTFYPKDAYVDYFDRGFTSKYRYSKNDR